MSLDDRAYSEKRDFIRMRVEAEVILEHEGKQYPAKCLDLSSTGMQVEVDAPLQLADRLQVRIPSEHSQLRGLDADVEGVRCSRLDDGRLSLGLTILAMR